MDVINKIADCGILPVIRIAEREKAVPLARALREGGVNALEVTARSDAAFDAIREIKRAFPDMAVGAGTILSSELVDRAIDAGAEYCVSPGLNPKTISYCQSKGMPVIPGCSSGTEMELALEMGLTTVKFFPAELNGGVKALELFHGPFPTLRFIPTGGMRFDNIGDYLKRKYVVACGGSYMADAGLVRDGNWEQIRLNCQRAMDLSLGFSLAHIGINHNSPDDAEKTAALLCKMLHCASDVRSECVFAGPFVEHRKHPFYGEKGHIGFRCRSLRRAMAYIESQGFAFNQDSRQYENGELSCIYLQDEIAGFAIHFI